jgi:hypothetical protein
MESNFYRYRGIIRRGGFLTGKKHQKNKIQPTTFLNKTSIPVTQSYNVGSNLTVN